MTKDEMIAGFYEGVRSVSVPFVINDAVEIISGSSKGKLASVISIEFTKAELSYLVEMGDGSGDFIALATNLRLK